MEYSWIIYSLAGLLLLGFGDFVKKVIIQKGASKEVFLFTCFLFYLSLLSINFIINGSYNFDDNLIKSGIIIGFFDSIAPLGLLVSFKYLEASFTLVFIRLFSSISIFFIGIYLLGDNLNYLNILGFLLGVIAIFLLSGYSFHKKNDFNKKGVIALLGTTVAIICSHSYFKYIVGSINIDNFMLLKFSVSFIFVLIYIGIRGKFNDFSIKEIKSILPFAFINGIIFVSLYLFILPNIYLLGPISLGYKILSYSLMVPIILSIIIYKEKITNKKIIAFILTILSLLLFL